MANSKISALTSATTPLAGTETLPVVQSGTTKQVSVANLTAGRTVAMQSTVLGGITMPSWAAPFDSVLQMKYSAITGSGASDARWFANSYYDGAYKYVANGYASRYDQSSGQHFWYTAANNAGGAGAACTFTQVWSIDTGGNLIPAVAAKGVNFTANTPAAGMTSQLLNWYEVGTWTPTVTSYSGTITTMGTVYGRYIRIGNQVTIWADCTITTNGTGATLLQIKGMPYAPDTSTVTNYAGSGQVRNTATALSIEMTKDAFANPMVNAYTYNGGYPGGNGAQFIFCVTYKV